MGCCNYTRHKCHRNQHIMKCWKEASCHPSFPCCSASWCELDEIWKNMCGRLWKRWTGSLIIHSKKSFLYDGWLIFSLLTRIAHPELWLKLDWNMEFCSSVWSSVDKWETQYWGLIDVLPLVTHSILHIIRPKEWVGGKMPSTNAVFYYEMQLFFHVELT